MTPRTGRLLLMMASLLVSPCLTAQETTGRLEGVVYLAATLATAEGAVVEIVAPRSQRVMTDARGYFGVAGVPGGRVSIQIRRIGSAKWRSDSITIENGRTTQLKVTLAEDHTFDIIQHERWLGCLPDSRARCLAPRGVLANVEEVVPGLRICRDSAALLRFWSTEHRSGFAPGKRLPSIDWATEMVVGVGVNAYSGCGPRSFVNRIEIERNVLIIVLGPDSLQVGGLEGTCMWWHSTIDLLVVPRRYGEIAVKPANPKWKPDSLFAVIRRIRRLGS